VNHGDASRRDADRKVAQDLHDYFSTFLLRVVDKRELDKLLRRSDNACLPYAVSDGVHALSRLYDSVRDVFDRDVVDRLGRDGGGVGVGFIDDNTLLVVGTGMDDRPRLQELLASGKLSYSTGTGGTKNVREFIRRKVDDFIALVKKYVKDNYEILGISPIPALLQYDVKEKRFLMTWVVGDDYFIVSFGMTTDHRVMHVEVFPYTSLGDKVKEDPVPLHQDPSTAAEVFGTGKTSTSRRGGYGSS
jgi:hypothetical protein